jgi:hypothetical protein
MAHVEWSIEAVAGLDSLIRTHSLPPDTRGRVKRSLQPLGRFPMLGPSNEAGDRPLRFVLGPWRWMILVYVYLEDEDRIVIVGVEDGRSATAVVHRD